MFLYKTRIKTLIRDKVLVFWTMIFPLLLATLYHFAFGHLSNLDNYETINVVLVDAESMPEEFVEVIETVEYGEERKMFNVGQKEKEEATKLLDKNMITGYIEWGEEGIFLTIKNSGLKATILKTFLDEYVQTTSIIDSIILKTQGAVDVETLIADIANQAEYLDYQSRTNDPNNTLLYFYALIAMAVINGSFLGTGEITNLQPNLSAKGVRYSVSPTKRYKLLLSNIAAAFTIHIAEVIILLIYLVGLLGITLGNYLYVLLLCVLGSLTGIFFGALLGITFRRMKEGAKIGICTVFGVFGSFLSGMMYPPMKYLINTKAPIIGYINPVNSITDGFYSLYYFTSLERYLQNVLILAIMLILFVSLTLLQYRRDSYESI